MTALTRNFIKPTRLSIVMAMTLVSLACDAYATNGTPYQQTSGAYVPGAAYDCSGVSLDQQETTSLTREEKIAQLEKSLQHSIDDYATCMQQVQADMASAGQQAGQAGMGQTGTGQDGSQQQSAQDAAETQSAAATTEQTATGQESTASQPDKPAQASGGPRQAVPPADNASILCTLLWEQIQQANDAVSKDKLTQQYLDYNCGQSK